MHKTNIRDINIEEFPFKGLLRDKIFFVLKYAVLAPSTHNSQPWLFDVHEDSCLIYPNNEKKILQADPLSRDLYISLGCCLENIVIASMYYGIFEKVNYFPEQKNGPVAIITFKNNSQVCPPWERLLKSILNRTNSRGIFNKRSIPNHIIARFQSLDIPKELELTVTTERKKITGIATLTSKGIQIAYNVPAFRKEMANWINNNYSKKTEGIPGYSLKIPNTLSVFLPFLIRYFNIGNKLGKLNLKSINSAPAIFAIGSESETPQSWLKVGRLAERLMLELNSLGVETSIFVASIEMGNLKKRARDILKSTTYPQFIFSAGYASKPNKYTYRNNLEEHIMSKNIPTLKYNTHTASQQITNITKESTKMPDFDNHEEIIKINDPDSGLLGIVAIHRKLNHKPSFGATRYLSYESTPAALSDALRLSKLMSYKSALAGLPYGGAKAVIIKNKTLSNRNHLLTSYTNAIKSLQGKFITGSDVGLNKDDVIFMHQSNPFIVGYLVNPEEYTAMGVYYAIEESLKEKFGDSDVSIRSFSIQGLGKVGMRLVDYLYSRGAKIIASDTDARLLESFKKSYPNTTIVEPNKVLYQKVDVLCPCALGRVINESNVAKLSCKIIAGGANYQLHNGVVGELLHEADILYAPDFLINSGGLISVTHEFKKNKINTEEIHGKVKQIKDTLHKVYTESREYNIPPNIAAINQAEKIIEQGLKNNS